jgi:DNA-binding protein HU-beta
VNKSQLIDALSARFEGNRKQAQHALESVLDTITREVARGEKVAITGFGSFEKRVREARWVRNPQTGERIKAKKTAVPKFTAGADLKNVVSGAKSLPKLTLAATSTAKKATSTAKKTAKKAAKKAAPAKKTTAKKTTAKKTTAKKTTAKKATATKTPAKSAAAKTSKSEETRES